MADWIDPADGVRVVEARFPEIAVGEDRPLPPIDAGRGRCGGGGMGESTLGRAS